MLLLEDKLGKIAEELLEILPYHFGMYQDQYDFYDIDCSDDIAEVANKYYGRRFWGECGASKAVIVPLDESYVIKMPFNGEYSENCDYDEDDEESDEEQYYFEKFYCAGGPDPSNYCEAEYYYYKKAREWGIDCLFAYTQKINDRVYIQEKIIFDEDDSASSATTVSEASSSSARELSNEKYCPVDIYWLAAVIERYGNEMAEKLLDFFDEYDIHDIHSSNRGWRANGDPVLSDFSSWDN